MNTRLILGDNKDPIVHIAVSADGTICFAGSSAGSFFVYDLDGSSLKKLENPRRYTSISGISFIGSSNNAIATALTAPATGDVVRLQKPGLVELLYADAPHPFFGVAMCSVADYGLLGSGEELLKWFLHEKSYLPVEAPLGTQIRAFAFQGKSQQGLVVGEKIKAGFVARYEPQPENGRLIVVATGPIPALNAVASKADGTLFLAGGLSGELLEVDGNYSARVVAGPKDAIIRAIAFHPKDGWAMIAGEPANGRKDGGLLYRYDPASGAVTRLHEGAPEVGAFTCVAMLPRGDRALVGTAGGRLLEIVL